MTQLRTINSSASFALCRERQKEKLQVSEERVAQLTEELQKMRVEQVRGTHSSPRPPAPRPPARSELAVSAHRRRRWPRWFRRHQPSTLDVEFSGRVALF